MGLMFRRRRPVMRMAAGAATAGVAYKAGKSKAQQEQVNQQAQAAYAASQQAPPPQYAPPQPAAPPAAPADDSGMGDLDRLVELHKSGALTDAEFSAAKAKLLGL